MLLLQTCILCKAARINTFGYAGVRANKRCIATRNSSDVSSKNPPAVYLFTEHAGREPNYRDALNILVPPCGPALDDTPKNPVRQRLWNQRAIARSFEPGVEHPASCMRVTALGGCRRGAGDGIGHR